mgnify:FL=1
MSDQAVLTPEAHEQSSEMDVAGEGAHTLHAAIPQNQDISMSKTEQDIVEIIGLDEEHHDRAIQRYDHARRREIVDELLQGTGRDRVLDLGCSNGSWYPFLKAQGFAELHGVELSEHRAQIARQRGYEVFNGHGQDTPFPDNHFDVVVNQEVLVHVLQEEDRKAMIAEAKRVLKPGGVYICSIASAVAQRRRFFINRITGYGLLSWIKPRLVGRQGREQFQDLTEFTRYWDLKDVRAYLSSIDLTVVDAVGHTYFFGDLSANFPAFQRLLDRVLGRRCPDAATVVYLKCTK